MKKSFLILAAGLVAGIANGQDARKSVLFNYGAKRSEVVSKSAALQLSSTIPTIPNNDPKPAVPGGVAGSRWYDYVNMIMGPSTVSADASFTGLNMWQNDKVLFCFPGTTPFDTVRFQSLAMGFMPYATAWNASPTFDGLMAITAGDTYTVDSVAVVGAYDRDVTDLTTVDTLVFTFAIGNGASTSELAFGLEYPAGPLPAAYGLVGGLPLLTMYYDSVNNRAGRNTVAITVPPINTIAPITAAGRVYKMLMKPEDTISINSHTVGELTGIYPRAGHSDPVINVSVPAYSFMSMSVSFISGETVPAYATVRNVDQTYNYGAFTPILGFAADGAGDPVFPPFVAGDWTTGYFKRINTPNSTGTYTPNWGWTTTGTSPSSLQYPAISYHVTCASCLLGGDSRLAVNNVTSGTSVKTYPNPANSVMNVEFTTAQAGNVVVTLSNVLGQVVATQNMGNVAKGNASFNTAGLAAGVYMYNVSVNNVSNTGRIVVAH
jgi:hypothetical protein